MLPSKTMQMFLVWAATRGQADVQALGRAGPAPCLKQNWPLPSSGQHSGTDSDGKSRRVLALTLVCLRVACTTVGYPPLTPTIPLPCPTTLWLAGELAPEVRREDRLSSPLTGFSTPESEHCSSPGSSLEFLVVKMRVRRPEGSRAGELTLPLAS